MKEFLLNEDGSVTECTSNLAKMNTFEWIWYFGIEWLFGGIPFALSQIKEGLPLVLAGLFNGFCMVVFPITWVIAARIRIRDAKKEMKNLKKY